MHQNQQINFFLLIASVFALFSSATASLLSVYCFVTVFIAPLHVPVSISICRVDIFSRFKHFSQRHSVNFKIIKYIACSDFFIDIPFAESAAAQQNIILFALFVPDQQKPGLAFILETAVLYSIPFLDNLFNIIFHNTILLTAVCAYRNCGCPAAVRLFSSSTKIFSIR